MKSKRLNLKREVQFDFSHVAHLVNGKRGREAERNCDPDGGIWSAGQVVGLIESIPTCEELMDEMIQEAEDTVRLRLNAMIGTDGGFMRSRL